MSSSDYTRLVIKQCRPAITLSITAILAACNPHGYKVVSPDELGIVTVVDSDEWHSGTETRKTRKVTERNTSPRQENVKETNTHKESQPVSEVPPPPPPPVPYWQAALSKSPALF